MLQQTQAARVVGFYRRFLRAFPTLGALARASWQEVLERWEGLGYYRRARSMLAAARILVKRHNSKFPGTVAELVQLPGIGAYTAAAIASFAFGQNVPALDTNTRRVLKRISGMDGNEPELAAKLFAIFPKNGRELNTALMDTGATICLSRKVHCELCPLCIVCRSRSTLASSLRVPAQRSTRKAKQQVVDVTAACIHKDGRYLLAKRALHDGGYWEFPGGKKEPGEDLRACLKREIQEELGVLVSVRPPFHVERWEKDGKLFRLHFSRCQILRGTLKRTVHAKLRWVSAPELIRTKLGENERTAAQILSQRFGGMHRRVK